ncbi:hypothetical protein E2C01_001091 [Portunus trituberculatus]|uniref:Uncharacterized protein n=1 Tax=Portunus trituberculatus TaxID=210409 RepID=A0A5B7CGW9_PORTR|nr:hypothetical protein [Portunus trituberculatus]
MPAAPHRREPARTHKGPEARRSVATRPPPIPARQTVGSHITATLPSWGVSGLQTILYDAIRHKNVREER